MLLDGPLQGACTKMNVISFLCDIVLGRGGDFEIVTQIVNPVIQSLKFDVNDLKDVIAIQGIEHHDVVHTVQELRGKSLFEGFLDDSFGIIITLLLF